MSGTKKKAKIKEGGAPSYYRPVAGSKDLPTRRLSDEDILAVDDPSFPDGKNPFIVYAGERLGRADAGEGASVPLDIFDQVASRLTPLEQAAFYQFIRLSLGEGRNFCRVGKRELISRTGISERRLLVALDGLVRKSRIRALHRNNSGTLYRVYMPGELPAGRAGEKGGALTAKTARTSRGSPEYNGDTYNVDASYPGGPGRAGPAPGKKARAGKPGGKKPAREVTGRKPSRGPRSRPLESPLNEERFTGVAKARGPSISVGDMVDKFFRAGKLKPTSEERDEAVTEITALLEDGYTREEIFTAVKWFSRNFPKEKSLNRLPYYIHEAISVEESE